MQPGTNPENIHTILNRFSDWSGKGAGNGHAKGLKGLEEGVREIPYEEAMQMMRSRKVHAAAKLAAAQPAAIAEAAPATTAAAAPLATTVHPPEKAGKPAPRKRPAAKKTPVVKTAKAEEPRAAARKRRGLGQPAQAEKAAEFRQVLAKSVRAAKPADKPAARSMGAGKKGRDQRVSVRFSSAEERRLQASAARAGVTVSEYLRMCALKIETAAEPETPMAPAAQRGKPAVEAAPEPVKQPRSGLGDWIALLRNRFLATPTRFAERA